MVDAAIYARTSTAQQKSCQAQLGICRRTARSRGLAVRFQLMDEAGKGQDETRPHYQRLLGLVEQQRVHVVVVWKLDRLFRSLKEASAAQELFSKHGVAIVSCTEPFDTTTPIGRFVFGFLANLAQFELELIRERAQLGHERRAREGKWPGAVLPYGYLRDDRGRLAVNAAEADLVRLLHARCKDFAGDRELAAWMNKQGHQHRGRRWTRDRVRKALSNRLSIGELDIRGANAFHPELVIVEPLQFQATALHRSGLQHRGTQAPPDMRKQVIDRVMDAYLEELRAEPEVV